MGCTSVLQLGFHGSRALTWGTLGVRYTPACKKGHAPYHVHVRHGQQHGAQALQVLLAHGAHGALAQLAHAAQLARLEDPCHHAGVHSLRQRRSGEARVLAVRRPQAPIVVGDVSTVCCSASSWTIWCAHGPRSRWRSSSRCLAHIASSCSLSVRRTPLS